MEKKQLNHSPVPPHIIEKMLANQDKELELRNSELEFRKQNDANQLEYAKEALKHKESSQINNNDNSYRLIKARYIFGGILASILFLFLGLAVFLNKTELAMEIIKAVIYISAGALGGYSYGHVKEKRH